MLNITVTGFITAIPAVLVLSEKQKNKSRTRSRGIIFLIDASIGFVLDPTQ